MRWRYCRVKNPSPEDSKTGAMECWSTGAKEKTKADTDSKCQMTKRSELSNFWIWDFDIHLTFGFWHLALIHSHLAKLHFFDPIIPIFLPAITPLEFNPLKSNPWMPRIFYDQKKGRAVSALLPRCSMSLF
jgi:hypothetical protein